MDSEGMLFRAIVSGKTEKLWDSGGLSYSRIRELLKEKLQQLGFPSNEYSFHSLRAGGVTVAAMAGIPDRVFKKHGWWKSDNAKDGYVEDSMDKRLSVSRSLGL